MAVREILLYPHPVLRRPTREVESFDDELRRLIDDLAETMYEAPGVGLAAPQVGVELRVAVVDAAPRTPGRAATRPERRSRHRPAAAGGRGRPAAGLARCAFPRDRGGERS